MSKSNIQLRFDGPDLRAHEMDVTLLAPALAAFGELCKEANRALNGDDVKVRVLMSADVKANCVTIQLALDQSLWEAAKNVIFSSNVWTAKEILTWIGLLGPVGGLAKYLLWKKAQKKPTTEVKTVINGNTVVYNITGDNHTFALPEPVKILSENSKVVESLKAVVLPVAEENGIDEAVFLEGNTEGLKVDQATAKELQDIYSDAPELQPQTFTAHIVLYGPIMDANAKKWKFKFNNRTENIDISDTSIAKDAIKRGHYNLGDTYRVKLEMTERQTPTGNFKSDYKVKEVIRFLPGHGVDQKNLALEDRKNRSGKPAE